MSSLGSGLYMERIMSLATYAALFSQKEKELKLKYNEMHDAAYQSLLDSRENVAISSENKKREGWDALEASMRSIRSMASEVKSLKHRLTEEDYDFERYCLTHPECPSATPLPSTIDESLAYITKVSSSAHELYSICIGKVRSRIAQIFFKKLNEDKLSLYTKFSEAIMLASRTADAAERFVYLEKESISAKHDQLSIEKISTAEKETRVIIEQCRNQGQLAVKTLIEEWRNTLHELLPIVDRDCYTDLIQLPESHELPVEIADIVSMGSLRIPVNVDVESETYSVLKDWCGVMLQGSMLILPMLVDLKKQAHLMLFSSDEQLVTDTMQDVLINALKVQPAMEQQVILFDPVGHGTNFHNLLPFVKQYPAMSEGQVFTSKQQMRECLTRLTTRMEELLQRKLIEVKDIFEYNSIENNRTEPLVFMCLNHFPREFDEDMLIKLLDLMEHGGKCGIQVMARLDENSLPLNRHDVIELLYKVRSICCSIDHMDGVWRLESGWIWTPPPHQDTGDLHQFMKSYAESYESKINEFLPIDDICGNAWSGNTTDLLSIPIGKNADGSIRYLEFGDPVAEGSSHHALIFGSLGSGKSTLLHTIIMSAIRTFSPDELELYLLDFKQGTEFQVYERNKVPHIKVLALDAMQEFGLSVLEHITVIAKDRLKKFKEVTDHVVTDISQYRRITGSKMPRILIVMDEFQVLFNEKNNRAVASECATRFAEIVAQYRVCGIHFAVATQTMNRIKTGAYSISPATMDEMKVRIGLKCNKNECNLVFGSDFGDVAFRNTGNAKGDGIYTDNVDKSMPLAMKVAFCDKKALAGMLSDIQHISTGHQASMRVFSGTMVPHISRCLMQTRRTIYLGEPIRIDAPVQIELTRSARSSMFICGSNADLSDKLITSYMISALHSFDHPKLYVLDANSINGRSRSERIKSVLNASTDKITLCENVFEVVDIIDDIYQIYEERRRQIRKKTYSGDGIFVVINNVQAIEPLALMINGKAVDAFVVDDDIPETDIHPSDMSQMFAAFAEQLSSPSLTDTKIPRHQKLKTLIESGYLCDIHVIATCADMQPFRNIMYEFIPMYQHRVVFGMSDTDAGRIISGATVEQMLGNIAVYSNGVDPYYQFKPYETI